MLGLINFLSIQIICSNNGLLYILIQNLNLHLYKIYLSEFICELNV